MRDDAWPFFRSCLVPAFLILSSLFLFELLRLTAISRTMLFRLPLLLRVSVCNFSTGSFVHIKFSIARDIARVQRGKRG